MKQTGKVAVGKVVLRDREDLVAVFPHEDGLVLQKLHYPHELRKMQDVPEIEGVKNLTPQKLNKNELKLAATLVQEMVTTLGEIDTEDNYHSALRKLIDAKIKGRKVVEFEEVEELPRLDIMSALKKSLQQSNRKPMVKAPATASKKKPQITLVKPKTAAKEAKSIINSLFASR
jgi:DNA end-binding protein Ku